MAKTKKDTKCKKVTSENKATQTVREERLDSKRGMIEPEDLTSTGMSEMFFSIYCIFLIQKYLQKYKKRLYNKVI